MDEFDTGAEAEAESQFVAPQTPRLSILHLMLWTLCTAVYLSLMRAAQGNLSIGFAAIQATSGVIQGIFTGALLTGAIVLVATRVRSGPPMLRQPGHWLLFVSAILHLLYVPIFIAFLLLRPSGGFPSIWFIAFYCIPHLVAPIGYSFAARQGFALRWNLIFVGLAVHGVVQCLLYVAFVFGSGSLPLIQSLAYVIAVGSLLLVVAVLVVLLVDWHLTERRDWLHWTGVLCYLGAMSLTWVWLIGGWLIKMLAFR